MIKCVFLDDFDALSNDWEENFCVRSICVLSGLWRGRSILLRIFGRLLHILNEFDEMFEDCDDVRAVFEANKVFTITYEC